MLRTGLRSTNVVRAVSFETVDERTKAHALSVSAIPLAGMFCLAAMVCGTATVGAQQSFGDAAAITQFQRSVDAYAFDHRQVQRRLGGTVDQEAMAAGMRAARPSAADGDFFEPIIAVAFRSRIASALRAEGCKIASSGARSSEVTAVGTHPVGTHPVPGCLLSVLPSLPEELQYRSASAVLILLDTHANMVVDVLHDVFPRQEDR